MNIEDVELKELIDSLTEDEFGAVTAVYAWMTVEGNTNYNTNLLGKALLERAEKTLSDES